MVDSDLWPPGIKAGRAKAHVQSVADLRGRRVAVQFSTLLQSLLAVESGARYDPIYWIESLATLRDQTPLRLCFLRISFHRYLALGVLKTHKQVYGCVCIAGGPANSSDDLIRVKQIANPDPYQLLSSRGSTSLCNMA
ncbi:MAG: hypothetical protein JWM42_3432 [Burkholderia sp.]|jgi:hypothetical protein|nr:hypothetical protein [Burkholderia sp.]